MNKCDGIIVAAQLGIQRNIKITLHCMAESIMHICSHYHSKYRPQYDATDPNITEISHLIFLSALSIQLPIPSNNLCSFRFQSIEKICMLSASCVRVQVVTVSQYKEKFLSFSELSQVQHINSILDIFSPLSRSLPRLLICWSHVGCRVYAHTIEFIEKNKNTYDSIYSTSNCYSIYL